MNALQADDRGSRLHVWRVESPRLGLRESLRIDGLLEEKC